MVVGVLLLPGKTPRAVANHWDCRWSHWTRWRGRDHHHEHL